MERSLTGHVFEQRTSTESGLFAILSGDFEHSFWANRLYKSKDTSQFKFGSVKAFNKRKWRTSSWRVSLKNTTRPEWLINPREARTRWITMYFHTLTKATFSFTVFNQPLRLTGILWVSITTFMISCSTGTWSEVWHWSQTTLPK